MADSTEQCGYGWTCLIKWDKAITKRLAVCCSVQSSWGHLRPVMRLLEYTGHGVPWFVGIPTALLASHQLDLQLKLINFLLVMVVDLVVIVLLKAVARRQRPAENEDDMLVVLVDKYSFPSGHATRAAMSACYILYEFDGLSSLWRMFIVFWAISVCVSRVMLGRHHVSDVVVGAVVGILEYVLVELAGLWLSADTCANIMRPIQEELYL